MNVSHNVSVFFFSRVTIMKDKDTRKSKGVAFILFLDKESAQNCSRALNNKQVSDKGILLSNFWDILKAKIVFIGFFSYLEE